MNLNRKVSAPEQGSSKWSNIKDFYENFKDELSDGDFSNEEPEYLDPEDLTQEQSSTSAWPTTETEVVWVEELSDDDDEVIFIEDENTLGNSQQRVNSKLTSAPKLFKQSVLNVSNKPKPPRKIKQALSNLSEEVCPSQHQNQVPKPTFKFQCEKCNKGSNKASFLDQHSTVQCERAQSIASRQSSVKKTFSF